jgi:transcriptional regulator with XRE-family HTH domain
MNKRLDLCEIWSLTLPAYSPHSRLYALEPLGLGTPNIESLTSYVSRLAEAHSVSLRTLVIQELLPLLKRDYLFNPFGNSLDAFWIEAARALNGTGILATDWAQALECLTLRTDLRFLTLLPWAAVLTQQRLLRITRAWCPDCFVEWQAAGRPIYEPLLWNMSAVSLCLRHQRTLLEQCPYPDCHATLPVLASRFRPGYCSKCSRWLGITPDPPDPSRATEEWHWHVWVTETIGELVSHNIDLAATPHLGNIPDSIAAYREQATNCSVQNLAERLQLSRRTVNAWRSGQQIPQIESLARLCYCCGVSLYDLFTLRSGTLNLVQLRIRSLPEIPNPTTKRRRRIPFDAIRIRQSLEAVLVQEEQPPPSMRTISKCLNYSPRELREHFPRLCRAISNRCKNYYMVRREQKSLQLKEEVRRATLEIHSQGSYPSWQKVGSLLSDPAAMRAPGISRFWREVLQELELDGLDLPCCAFR